MKLAIPFTLFLPILVAAQTPTQAPTPAPSLASIYKAQAPAVEQLMSQDPKEALAKALAMIPAQPPVIDKSSPQKTLASLQEQSALMDMHTLAGKAARVAGDWDLAKAQFADGQTVAKQSLVEVTALLTPLMDQWKKAIADSQKLLDESGAHRTELEAKATRTPQEDKELAAYKVAEGNVKNGPVILSRWQKDIDSMKKDSDAFAAVLEGLDKDSKSEAENIAKVKGDKKAYVAAVMKNPENLAKRETVIEKLALLDRLAYLDPSNKAVQQKIDQVLGKAPATPAKNKKSTKKG